MITRRPAAERGHTKLAWLDSRHTFSFDQYYDPRFMGFRHLRVINEDWVQPAQGFGTHPHRDMEILTYLLEGALEHKDSLGNGSVISPGHIQRMSAGTGVTHSEFNHSRSQPVHLLQIWILPRQRGLPSGYEQREFSFDEADGSLRLLAAPDGREGAVTIQQDAELYVARLPSGNRLTYQLKPGRHAWLQVARGAVDMNDISLEAGDGAAVSQEESLTLTASESGPPAEVLLFDLA